jgi:hypothetical protein
MKSLLLTLLIFTSPFVFAGNDGGHGGDTYGKEFEELGRILHQTMLENSSSPVLAKWNVKPSLFLMAVESTLLRSAEGSEVRLNGYEVDLINNSDTHIILLNRTRWREKNLYDKLQIVLHEYLGIIKIEVDHYYASNDFSDILVKAYNNAKKIPYMTNANVFYGYQEITTSLGTTTICNPQTQVYKDALANAETVAMEKCKLNKLDCRVIERNIEPVISVLTIGYRYCSITVVADGMNPK